MTKHSLYPVAAFLFAIMGYAHASDFGQCSKEEAVAAEIEISTLKNWDALYRSFIKFSKCDDGAISEGYSDVVSRLLSDKSEGLLRINTLASQNKEFEHFVIHHIDELMLFEQAPLINLNVRQHCPSEAKQLCRKIIAKMDELQTRRPAPSASP